MKILKLRRVFFLGRLMPQEEELRRLSDYIHVKSAYGVILNNKKASI